MTDNENDLKALATSTKEDFYSLLSIAPGASETEISSAYRKTARQYHPDKLKVTLQNPTQSDLEAAAEKFHLVQLAHSILSSPSLREIYDHARRAREAKKARDEAVSGRRREMMEELARGERSAKRKREGVDTEDVDESGQGEREREMRRLAEEGRRMRVQYEEKKRREAEAEAEEEERRRREREDGVERVDYRNGNTNDGGEIPDIDRSITLRWLQSQSESQSQDPSSDISLEKEKATLTSLLTQQFGPIAGLTLRTKRLKHNPSDKHRSPYIIATIVFESQLAARNAINSIPTLSRTAGEAWGKFEEVTWASGRGPSNIAKSSPLTAGRSQEGDTAWSNGIVDANSNGAVADGERAGKPRFASFKKSAEGRGVGPSLDEFTMMRLQNAERRRLEKKAMAKEMEGGSLES